MGDVVDGVKKLWAGREADGLVGVPQVDAYVDYVHVPVGPSHQMGVQALQGLKYDAIKRPAHYKHNEHGIECIDAIRASMSKEQFQGYLKGNVQKYVWRFEYKDGVKDLRKAQQYLAWLIEELDPKTTTD